MAKTRQGEQKPVIAPITVLWRGEAGQSGLGGVGVGVFLPSYIARVSSEQHYLLDMLFIQLSPSPVTLIDHTT